ncbi:MAG: ATP-dependent helicase HrpB [Geminicoccaceae bacterium]
MRETLQLREALRTLPVAEAVPGLRRTLADAGRAVLTAPPGSGKTTLVPLLLLAEPWLAGAAILMLEPRRLATRQAAERMADLLGEKVGETVGYAMRFERRASPATRLEVVTEGLFVRRLQADPGLDGVGLVIFDEFHERSLDADLGLALAREVKGSLRPDLRLLVMSATLDAEAVSGFLDGAPVIRATGRQHPVTLHHLPGTGPAEAARIALDRQPGDVLVFLPGVREIERTAGELAGSPAEIHKLHGALPKAQQDAALRPSPGRRRIVLATNIAETSLTIEGIGSVVDAGFARRSRYSPRTGMSRLETVRISRASADQRSGRAGRLGPGHAFRLWPEAETLGLAPADPPEIAEADLAPLALELAIWGVREANGLAMPTTPPEGAWRAARDLLVALDALDESGDPTPHGRAMAALPVHPRLAHMLLEAARRDASGTALALAALLGERDPWAGRLGPDLAERLARWAEAPPTLHRTTRQLARRLGIAEAPPDPATAGLCAALAFPDRIAQRRRKGAAELRLVNGRGARLVAAPELDPFDLLVVAESEDAGSDARVRLAAGLAKADLDRLAGHRLTTRRTVGFDTERGTVLAEEQERLGALVLARRPVPVGDDEAVPALLDAIRRHGLAILPWSRSNEALRQRLAWLARVEPAAWPPVDDATLLAGLELWLAPWLAGIRRPGELDPASLREALLARLDPAARSRLDHLAPPHWTTPLGRDLAIDYGSDRPAIACRLQELLGLDRHPTLPAGRPLRLELLSPAGRPIQVTDDLPGFWRGSYALVRKDLRGRYPKHPWPENPLSAAPWRPGLGRG